MTLLWLYSCVPCSVVVFQSSSLLLFLCCSIVQIDTLKRLCIKKLPQILVIQLKRFDYDWERCVPECVNSI